MPATTFVHQARFALLSIFLFTYNLASAQSFDPVDEWLQQHAKEMGGRALLMVYKEGKIVYANAVNNMTGRQKTIGRMIARRQGKEGLPEELATTTRLPVASCSKWLSAALVMTFVDEGKLKLTDTVGTWLPALTQNGKGSITIGQCLSHLTAIKTPTLRESITGMQNTGSMEEAIEKLPHFR